MSITPSLQDAGTAPASERRASPRKGVMDRRLVTVSLDNKDAGLMVDLGEGGMAVQALARIRQGAATSVQFELPDAGARIQASGTVAWVDEASGRAGIRFRNLPEASTACLKKWLGNGTSANGIAAAKIVPPPDCAPALPGAESKVAEIAALQREITSQGLEGDAALGLIVERARGLTRADGVAIVLGDSKRMTCRAATGSAPPVGVELQPEVGISGECVRTGLTVRCEDTEVDRRVDREACRSINLRSAVIVPLFAHGNVSGLLEVFYSSPHSFDGRDVLLLRRMADLISATLSGSGSREPKPAAALAPESAAHAAPLIPPVPGAASKAGAVLCNVCGHPNARTSSACAKCDGPLLANAATAAGPRAVAAVVPSVQSPERKPWLTLRLNASPRLLALIAVLLLLVCLLAWQHHKSQRAGAVPVDSTALESQAPSVVSAAAPISGYDPPFPEASLPSSRVPSGQSFKAVVEPINRLQHLPARDFTTTVVRKDVERAPVPAADMQRAAGTKGDVLPPPVQTTLAPVMATLPPTPVMTPKLSSVSPVKATASPARLVHRVEPTYPRLAVTSRVQGPVLLKATVLRNGRLGRVQVISGNDLLAGAALRAVQQWRYKPMHLDGQPVESETTIQIDFWLGNAH